ncbi:MAG TPA: peptide chain release factor 3, partial [Oceanithermus sp.]|nr:peptide chain release factor 3 [Oceanithermus sp.]
MLGKDAIERAKRLAGHSAPVLSLYVQVNPADPNVSEYTFDYKQKPYVIRAKDTLKALGVPREIAERVLFRLEHDAPQAVTRAIFAGEDFLEVFDLGVELPVVDLRTGLVEARWGEPYVAPLLFALDEYERYGVVLLDRERWRLFEVFMNQIEEVLDAFRAVAPEEWRRLSESRPAAPRTVGGYAAAAKGGTAKDKFDRRLLEWTHRFYKARAVELARYVEERGIQRVILMGPEEDTKYFSTFLPKAMGERVVAHLPAPDHPRVAPGEVLLRVRPAIERIEREEEYKLLDR